MISFLLSSQKCQLISSDRKLISFMGWTLGKEELAGKEMKEGLQSVQRNCRWDGYIHYLDFDAGCQKFLTL